MQARGRSLSDSVAAIPDRDARIEALYRRALGRDPTGGDIALAKAYLEEREAQIGREPWDEYAHTLLSANELSFLN